MTSDVNKRLDVTKCLCRVTTGYVNSALHYQGLGVVCPGPSNDRHISRGLLIFQQVISSVNATFKICSPSALKDKTKHMIKIDGLIWYICM